MPSSNPGYYGEARGEKENIEKSLDSVSVVQINAMMAGVKAASPTHAEKIVQSMPDEVYVSQWCAASPPEKSKDASDLKALASVWKSVILDAEIVDPLQHQDTVKKKNGYKTAMKRTANSIRLFENYQDGQQLKFPSGVAGEKDAVQPIIYALLRALSGIGDGGRDDGSQERRHEPGCTGGNRRFMDFKPCFVDGFFPILLPHKLSVALEVKKLTRKNKPADAMHEDVVKQLTGYMAKRILVAFEVGNVGVNAAAVGVLITPVYVQVLRLELAGMGTQNVGVKLVKTKLAPLVCHVAFE
jgi:hypothetical protein